MGIDICLPTHRSNVSLWLDVLEGVESNYIYVLYTKPTYLSSEPEYVSPSKARMTWLMWLMMMLRPGEHVGLSLGQRNPMLLQQKEGPEGQS